MFFLHLQRTAVVSDAGEQSRADFVGGGSLKRQELKPNVSNGLNAAVM